MTSTSRPRIGVAGVGALGFHHARILSSLDGVVMAGVFDTRAERAAEVADKLGVEVHASLEALLDGCDALVIAVLQDVNLAAMYCDRLVCLQAGRLFASGPVASVLTAQTLREVFGVEARVAHDDFTGSLQVALKREARA